MLLAIAAALCSRRSARGAHIASDPSITSAAGPVGLDARDEAVREDRALAASSRTDSSTLCVISGITFSSKCPRQPMVTATSLPMTAPRLARASRSSRVHLAGMMLLPGCVAGRRISADAAPRAAAEERMSLAIFDIATAIVLT
jgi:hypothetical protein